MEDIVNTKGSFYVYLQFAVVWLIHKTWLALEQLFRNKSLWQHLILHLWVWRLQHVECVSLAAYFIIYPEIYSRVHLRSSSLYIWVYSDVSVQISQRRVRVHEFVSRGVDCLVWNVIKWICIRPQACNTTFLKLFMHIDVNLHGVPRNTSMLMRKNIAAA